MQSIWDDFFGLQNMLRAMLTWKNKEVGETFFVPKKVLLKKDKEHLTFSTNVICDISLPVKINPANQKPKRK